MKVLPMLALSAVAVGYFGAIGHTNEYFDTRPVAELTSYPASSNLSVNDIMERPAQTANQPFCDQTAEVTATLASDFAESEQSAWVEGKDMALQLWGSDMMGTWTLLHVGQDGIACVVSSGTGWSEGVTHQDILAMADIATS